MKNYQYFILLIAVLSIITIPVLLLIIPYHPPIDRDFTFFLLYPGTIIFIILIYVRMRNKCNLLLLPLSFILLLIIHYVAGFFVVSLYSNPHPEWIWCFVGFFLAYIVPFFIITLVISTVIEITKYKIKQRQERGEENEE